MAAEPRQVASAEFWTRWEGQVVDGVFPLRRLLGCSDRAAVFLTEHKAKNLPNAAIKLVRTDGLGAQAQLKQWKAAAALSHPHLVQLFDMGRWRPGRREFVYVVMEYAEQTLDQILSQRALAPDEVREMLPPTLDALAYLHRSQQVHGRIRPSNLLAVNDQLKLASDNVRAEGHANDGTLRISWYDPPELNESGASAPGDVWGFGMTLLQALTLRTPEWPDQRSETTSLPTNLPTPFVGLVRRCLSRTPANRPTVVELEAPFKSALRGNSTADTPPPSRLVSKTKKTAAPRSHRKRNLSLAVAASLLIAAGAYVTMEDTSQTAPPAPLASVTPPPPTVAAPVIAKPVERVAQVPIEPIELEVTPKAVLYEAKPIVPQDLSDKIRDPVDVTLRVLVDASGDVMGALMENPGRNKSLAKLADNAAREWKFAETEQEDPRVWLLRFEFTRDGVTASATEQP